LGSRSDAPLSQAVPGVADLPGPSRYRTRNGFRGSEQRLAGLARDESRGDALVNCRPPASLAMRTGTYNRPKPNGR